MAGAGLSGATAARTLAEAGCRVLVIERGEQIGGQCYDHRNPQGITVHRYGPHIFHTNDETAWAFVRRFADFNSYQHRVLSSVDGKLLPFPINRSTLNQLFGLQLSSEQVPAFLRSEVEHSSLRAAAEQATFRDAVVEQVGERLYALFFENYTRKQWECDPATLSASLAGRIPVRTDDEDRYFTDLHQGLPVDGYTAMIGRMLDHPNIEVRTRCDYFNHRAAQETAPRLTVYTGPLDRYFDHRHGRLQYRSVRIEFETLPQADYQPAGVVNYPNDHNFTRITEFKKMTLEESSSTTLCREYPTADGPPFYVVPSAENTARRERYMAEVAPLEAAGSHLFAGRLAEYRYYNMDGAVAAALDKTNRWIAAHGPAR